MLQLPQQINPALSSEASAMRDRSTAFAVVTISTPNFIPGTLVMIYSYLKYNPWYVGDFIILTDEVSPDMERHLKLMPNVKFQIVGAELLQRSKSVAEADKTGKIFESHFYSLELFNIKGYEKLFYVDSDMLILGSFLELFEMPDPMICVGDSFYYKGQLRNGASYEQKKARIWDRKDKLWSDNFNAGLILFDQILATEEHYRKLLEMVTTDGYSQEAMRLQDQMIQNIYFRGQYRLVSAKYNLRLGIAQEIEEKDGVKLEDAVVIHYTARKKPWLHHEALDRLTNNENYYEPFRLWQEHWAELTALLHQQFAIKE